MEQDATKTMERCINDIRIWMLTDKLKLNEDKTEFMVIGTRPQLGKVSTAKNLGVWLDSHKYITYEFTPILVHAVAIGQIDCCNSLLRGLSNIKIDKLQRGQNVVARRIPTVRVIVT